MLPGLAGVAGFNKGAAVTVEYGGSAADAPPFSQSMAIGTAAANRRVLVCVAYRGTTATLGSCTVAGQSCTLVNTFYVDFGIDQQNLGIYITDNPVTSGTTATVVWDTTDSSGAAAVAQTYAIYGASPTVFDSGFDTNSDPSTTIDIPEKGVAFGFSAVRTASDSCTWTGATEGGQATTTLLETSVAAYTSDIPIVGRTLQATWVAGSIDMLTVISFGPE